MKESEICSRLVKHLRTVFRQAVVFKHADQFTAGVPDISFTFHGRTTWLELKHAKPSVQDTGLQAANMLRLANAGQAYYVIFDQQMDQTFIVEPQNLKTWRSNYTAHANGYNYEAVANFLSNIHLQ